MVFAGPVLVVKAGYLCTRIHNPNSDPKTVAPNLKLAAYRFCAEGEYGSGRQMRGQISGHLQRVLDHCNMLSQGFAVLDILYLHRDLVESGWKTKEFIRALRRSAWLPPRVQTVVELAEKFIFAVC